MDGTLPSYSLISTAREQLSSCYSNSNHDTHVTSAWLKRINKFLPCARHVRIMAPKQPSPETCITLLQIIMSAVARQVSVKLRCYWLTLTRVLVHISFNADTNSLSKLKHIKIYFQY